RAIPLFFLHRLVGYFSKRIIYPLSRYLFFGVVNRRCHKAKEYCADKVDGMEAALDVPIERGCLYFLTF
ncbi:hypothetical protein, partial [Pectobacterium carotovorum]|uniref:hypothetical protein n=1 Tax=Pectobacterium carotovorum TaxID=554 RepID=UPI00301A3ED1